MYTHLHACICINIFINKSMQFLRTSVYNFCSWLHGVLYDSHYTGIHAPRLFSFMMRIIYTLMVNYLQ